jgi:catechol-2,3-dioxygenase
VDDDEQELVVLVTAVGTLRARLLEREELRHLQVRRVCDGTAGHGPMVQTVRVSIPVARLNHAVLYVRDATRSAEFYGRVFGFEVVESAFGGRAVFMRAAGGDNHHDLGLFSVGDEAPRPPRGSVGLYHLAWEVPTIDDLAEAARVLSEAGALGGASDHGVSKSLYGADPDGNEFEIMWRVPREAWGEFAEKGVVLPLDLDAEVRRWGAAGAARA